MNKKTQTPTSRHGILERRADLAICIALLLAVLAIYGQVAGFDFVNFDDPAYITDNPQVQKGISMEGLRWAFTSGESGYWFPVTRVSELLDCQLFGLRSGAHHLSNLLWHALATLFLFAFLRRATGARWPSAWVAFLFALHPLHVESVAWVTERKDVLSAFLWFLTLWAYVRYTERPVRSRYLLVAVCFCLGLMSKPMVVTLPVVLLLMDVWPLRRCSWKAPILREKIPLFVLSAASAIVTYLAQRSAGAVATVSAASLGLRIGNALVSYVVYVGQTFWPAHLAVFYPYRFDLPVWQPILAASILAGITIVALRWFPHRPYLAAGWLWYLVTLLPVIGLVQVGEQARADRFTYLPICGLLIMLAWAPRTKPAVIALAAAACVAAAAATWVQIGYWRNSESLWRHALDVTQDNYLAHYQLGVVLAETPDRLPEAIAQYQSALRIKPNNPAALNNLGIALSKTPGRLPEAIAAYQAALRIQPENVLALNNLGAALTQIPGRMQEAIASYRSALRIRPDDPSVHYNLGQALAKAGQFPEAVSEYQTALRIDPDYVEAHKGLAGIYSEAPGHLPDAIAEYQSAIRIRPNDAALHKDLGNSLARSSRFPDAIAEYQEAIRLRPDFAEAYNNLGFALVNVEGRLPQAIEQFEAALRIQPDYRDAQSNLGFALLKVPGRTREAIAHLEAALRLRPDPQLQQTVDRLKAGRQ
jgi:tetratricopeptide (TPR) repeat protein